MNAQEIIDELQTLDMKNPGGWPLYARIGAVVLAAAAILAGSWFGLIDPLREQLEKERRTEVGLRQEFERKQKKVAALDAYKEQLKEMERSFGSMLRQLPSKTEVANLLNDISQTRIASGLEEELFKPLPQIPRDFYAEIPNQIIVIGSYHQMGEFVSGIATLSRIVTIEDVEIKPVGKGGKPGTSNLRMQAQAKTYRYLDDEELAAQKPQPKPGARK
jgi:type IV pilus assembly protein PilO